MSTPNFKCNNTNKIYAFGGAKYTKYDEKEECFVEDDNGTYDEDYTQMCYEDAIRNVKHELLAKGYDETDEWNHDRSYPSHFFAEKRINFEVCGVLCEIELKPCETSAYYDGACFDYDASLNVMTRSKAFWWCGGYYNESENYDYDLTGDYAVGEEDVLADDWCANKGLDKIHAKRIIKRIYAELDKLTTELEEVFAMYCDSALYCIGIFSNGEAVYSLAN